MFYNFTCFMLQKCFLSYSDKNIFSAAGCILFPRITASVIILRRISTQQSLCKDAPDNLNLNHHLSPPKLHHLLMASDWISPSDREAQAHHLELRQRVTSVLLFQDMELERILLLIASQNHSFVSDKGNVTEL